MESRFDFVYFLFRFEPSSEYLRYETQFDRMIQKTGRGSWPPE